LNIESVKLVTFSPTGNSKKVAEAIAKGTQAPIEHVDLTAPKAKSQDFEEFHEELAIITSPVYVGRVPYEAAYRLRRLKANNTPAVLVITYGNRAYEDTLIELSDIVSEVGFKPIAACAFIGEHSFSTTDWPTAQGRPNVDDFTKAKEFGDKIREKFEGIDDIEGLSPVEVPGVNPYTLRASRFDPGQLMSPRTDDELCIRCGKCTEACPTTAVTLKDVFSNPSPRVGVSTSIVSDDEDVCIWCCACVRACPTGARVRRTRMLESSERISKNNPERKEPETYI
jgi:ferredoxin